MLLSRNFTTSVIPFSHTICTTSWLRNWLNLFVENQDLKIKANRKRKLWIAHYLCPAVLQVTKVRHHQFRAFTAGKLCSKHYLIEQGSQLIYILIRNCSWTYPGLNGLSWLAVVHIFLQLLSLYSVPQSDPPHLPKWRFVRIGKENVLRGLFSRPSFIIALS